MEEVRGWELRGCSRPYLDKGVEAVSRLAEALYGSASISNCMASWKRCPGTTSWAVSVRQPYLVRLGVRVSVASRA